MDDYRQYLAGRVFPHFTDAVVAAIENRPSDFQQLYALIFDDDIAVAWHAAWCCDKISERHPELFDGCTEDLITFVMQQTHSGIRRLLFSILLNIRPPATFPVRFMNYCYERIDAPHEAVAVQVLAIKLLYRLCLLEPQLFDELKAVLENIETARYTPSMGSCVRNTLKRIKKISDTETRRRPMPSPPLR
jgi:hypothetical protein